MSEYKSSLDDLAKIWADRGIDCLAIGNDLAGNIIARILKELEAARKADQAELLRLRDEARSQGICCAGLAQGIETAARVMGRPLPEWVVEKT